MDSVAPVCVEGAVGQDSADQNCRNSSQSGAAILAAVVRDPREVEYGFTYDDTSASDPRSAPPPASLHRSSCKIGSAGWIRSPTEEPWAGAGGGFACVHDPGDGVGSGGGVGVAKLALGLGVVIWNSEPT